MTKKIKKEIKTETKPAVSNEVFEAFKKDYQEVCEKHGVGLLASLDISQAGIAPKLSVAPLKKD